jgi:glycosyltransferase involved in cell wall biosynthesis
LQAEAARLSIPVRFHGHVADVRSYLDGLDVFVLPSRAENLPVSIMEAMAHALPVIATHVGGVPEIVEDGVSGILVEPDDSAALACAISALADQPERAVRLGRNGARRAAQEFNAGVLAPRMVGLYDDLLSGRALGSAPVRGGGRLESSPP